MSDLDSIPDRMDLGRAEIYPLVVDFGPNARTGETLQSAIATLTNPSTGQDLSAVGVQGPPSVSGVQALVILRGSGLDVGTMYDLCTVGTFGPNKVLEVFTEVWVREK